MKHYNTWQNRLKTAIFLENRSGHRKDGFYLTVFFSSYKRRFREQEERVPLKGDRLVPRSFVEITFSKKTGSLPILPLPVNPTIQLTPRFAGALITQY